MLSQSSVVAWFEVEDTSLLTVLSTLSPVVIFGTVSYLVITVVISIDNHEDILKVFSQYWGALWAIHDSVKIIELLLHFVGELVRQESHVVHELGRFLEVHGVVSRIDFVYWILVVFHLFLVEILGSLMPKLFLKILDGQLLTVCKGLDRVALMLNLHIFLVNFDLFPLLYILVKLVKGFFRILSTMILRLSLWALAR